MNLKACAAALLGGWCVWNGSVSGQDLPPSAPYYALSYWTFSDTNDWTSDLDSKPLSYSNLGVSDLGDGTALVVDSTNAAWLTYPVIDGDQTNLVIGTPGSLAFWFAPSWSGTNSGGSGPGVWGRLIEAGTYTTNASLGWWSLYTDPAGCNLYFSAQTNNGTSAVYLSAPIAWTTNKWHFVILTYSPTNASLYLDGTLATNQASGVAISPPASALTNGFSIGSSGNGSNQAHGMFDDLETYGYVLTAHTISNFFSGSGIQYWANPLNTANLASAPFDPPYPSPGFRAIMGTGYVHQVSFSTGCLTNINVWMTNVTAALTNNGTMDLTFTIAGGAPDVAYDVFATGGLVGNSITNAQWVWLGQGYACGTYVITNLPGTTAMFVLGTQQDSDGDGLTDAFETLVSKTDPHNASTLGDGLPDYWHVIYAGTAMDDPYGDADGDGWSNLQEFQNGTNPNQFNTPPPPQNVIANVDNTGTNVTVTWQSGGGPVTNYVIQIGYYNDTSGSSYAAAGSVGPNVFAFNGTLPYPASGVGYQDPGLRVLARFSDGSSAASDRVGVCAFDPRLTGAIRTIRGPGCHTYLVASALPANVALLHFFNDSGSSSFDIAATNIVNGIVALPDGMTEDSVQAVNSNGVFGAKFPLTPYIADEELYSVPQSFPNASVHMRENLKFLLRSASKSRPFAYLSDILAPNGGIDYYLTLDTPQEGYARAATSTNYEYYGYHTYSPNLGYSFIEEMRPVIENFLWSNFVYTTEASTLGAWDTSDCGPDTLVRTLDPLYQYPGPNTATNPSVALTTSDGEWLFYAFVDTDNDPCGLGLDIGITTNGSNRIILEGSMRNCFGLNITSAYTDGYLLQAGAGTSGILGGGGGVVCYSGAEVPSLGTTNYYFASQTPYFNYNYSSGTQPPPIPGSSDFTVTNTSPLLITGLGQPITVMGWAKQAIVNGYSGKFAYLEQYFDKAYLTGTNGAADTNKPTGVLSPYGEFMPTDPGTVAILTVPDVGTDLRGTGIVNVIKVQLDVNHDGQMDLSLAGPDNTSPNRPFVFWINNNYDRLSWDRADGTNYEDSIAAPPAASWWRFLGAKEVPDYSYGTGAGRAIPTMRDLEDFARMWLCGVTTNLLAALPAGATVTLSWGDVGNANTNNPTIDLFQAADADGGIGYLTNAASASAQTNIAIAPYVQRLGPGDSIQLNGTTWAGQHFIWCGVNPGSGALTLTITSNGTNVLAQTAAYIQLKDIKEMYERRTVGEDPAVPPATNAILAQEGLTIQFHYEPPTNGPVPYILYVHGWNLSTEKKDMFAESAFKRLYWQGYQGRFGTFRWPTDFGFEGSFLQMVMNPAQKDNFDRSEFQAWQSAPGLLNLLVQLHASYGTNLYLFATSHGNVVCGEALRLAGTNRLVNTYIASQAAVTAHTYDPSIANYSFFYLGLSASAHTPNIYGNWFGTNRNHSVGQIFNYYNVNDYALRRNAWQLDQLTKPDSDVALNGTNWNYSYNGSSGDPVPWNNFSKTSVTNGTSTNSVTVAFDIVTNIPNRYEVMSFAAQSWTTAFGATPVTSNITANVDLGLVWPPDTVHPATPFDEHFYHSAQFRGANWQQQNYWRTFLSPNNGLNLQSP